MLIIVDDEAESTLTEKRSKLQREILRLTPHETAGQALALIFAMSDLTDEALEKVLAKL